LSLLIFSELKLLTLCAVAFVEQHDTDGITCEDDESNGSNATPPSNRPSHARKKREEGNGL
jgi:hypothetical protein